MSAALILPILPGDRITSASVGPLIPATAAFQKELRHSLPPALVEALDKIGGQIEVEILDPLLSAASAEHLSRDFERMFPRFRDYYVSTVLIMWGGLQDDPRRFSALTVRTFQESERFLRAAGPRWIGRDASLHALQGLATITRIMKVAARALDRGAKAAFTDQPAAEQWTNSIIAYVMSFSAVLATLSALTNHRTTSARLENAAVLAQWSKSYAAQAYHFSKSLGLLRTLAPDAPVGLIDEEGHEEDTVLAESGLDSYRQELALDDQP